MPDRTGLTVRALTSVLAAVPVPRPFEATLADIERLEELGRDLRKDARSGARRHGERLLKAAALCRRERSRVLGMMQAEAAFAPPDAVTVAGVDEAGRGPLAGPVVAAAVVLDPGVPVPGVDDSKRLPEDVRELVFDKIRALALHVGVGVVGTAMVERINVLQATYLAMRRAVAGLGCSVDYAVVDGFRVPGLDVPHRGVIRGDAVCASIAAASIVAKVTRDRIMRRVGIRYPAYGFERNKGYATAEHWEALKRHGPCPAHRLSFITRAVAVGDDAKPEEDPAGD